MDVSREMVDLYGGGMLGVESAEELAETILRVASSTGKNKNSMLQDVLAGRPTEVDFLNGYVEDYATSVGKAAPVNALLRALVKAREGLYAPVADL